MAIYGVGTNWGGEEQRDRFFVEGKFILGWNEHHAADLYEFISALKVGDILYMKANRPGSRSIRVKGIGIVKRSLMSCMLAGELEDTARNWKSLFVHVEWLVRNEFTVKIDTDHGRLTNIRAATVYEEYLPQVQERIIAKLIEV